MWTAAHTYLILRFQTYHTSIYTGLIILEIFAGIEKIAKHQQYEMRKQTELTLRNGTQIFALEMIQLPSFWCFFFFFLGLAVGTDKTMITSKHIHINTNYVVTFTSRGNNQSEIDLMLSVHVRNAFTKSLLFWNSWSFMQTTPSHADSKSIPYMSYFVHCQPLRSLNLLLLHLSWRFCLTKAFFFLFGTSEWNNIYSGNMEFHRFYLRIMAYSYILR